MDKNVKCNVCEGSGQVHNPSYRGTQFEFESCKLCNGNGKRTITVPDVLSNPDYSNVKALAENYISDLVDKQWASEDVDHWIFESVMEAVYGPDVWTFINGINR